MLSIHNLNIVHDLGNDILFGEKICTERCIDALTTNANAKLEKTNNRLSIISDYYY
ncbi:hypothetical protein Glove_431g17 [Diversispora epigaea]|uniref:Uncharacterized protein n=1 Tax=Diversispora epigaea TaxID=1348612 RepID=A0A397GX88_9GLOM|nr:hypothetical protein Glove_431g17 [Diversispora epigaea]